MDDYPDVMVICGPVETMDRRANVPANPVLVSEVLSPGTAGDDRGAKSREYRAGPTIRRYALPPQERPLVEIHTRGEDGKWWISEVTGLESQCEFSSLGWSV